jgi:hypothetical protein
MIQSAAISLDWSCNDMMDWVDWVAGVCPNLTYCIIANCGGRS